MTSLRSIQQLESLTSQLAAQGMRLELKNTHGAWSTLKNLDIVVVYPSAEGLPYFAKDAELFVGTLDDVQCWIAGVQWMSNYINIIGLDNGSRRQQREHAERERQLLESLRTGEQPRLRR